MKQLRRVLASAVALAGLGSALFTSPAYAAQVVVKLVSENGFCLTADNAAINATPTQTDCAHAHNFVWDQDHHNIFVQGHPGFCIVSNDPNLPMFIESCSNGRSVLAPDATDGNYLRFRFVNVGTYAHANGNNQSVSMITNPGNSLAVYWWPEPV